MDFLDFLSFFTSFKKNKDFFSQSNFYFSCFHLKSFSSHYGRQRVCGNNHLLVMIFFIFHTQITVVHSKIQVFIYFFLLLESFFHREI